MEINEIIMDALVYPINNIYALIVYIILGIVAGLAGGATIAGFLAASMGGNAVAFDIVGFIGLVITLILVLLIAGYELDIVKFAINRSTGAPGIDIARQVINAIKLVIVNIVYYIIPVIIGMILGFLLGGGLIPTIIMLIVAVVFTFAQIMAKCRLAKTEDLGTALNVFNSIGDIISIGYVKVVATILIAVIIVFIIALILCAIINANATIGGILAGIMGVYITFFMNRAIGLLYSDL